MQLYSNLRKGLHCIIYFAERPLSVIYNTLKTMQIIDIL